MKIKLFLATCLLMITFLFAIPIIEGQGISRNVRDVTLLHREAKEAENLRNYPQALRIYQKVLEINPHHVSSYLGAAKIYMVMGDYLQAQTYFESILQENLKSSEANLARTGLSKVFMKLGRAEDAYKLLSGVQKKDPANVENIYAFGLWHGKEGNHEQAKRYYDRSLNLEPTHLPSILALARLSVKTDRPIQAKKYLDRAMSISQEDIGLYEAQGHLYLYFASKEERVSDRIEYLERAYAEFLTVKRFNPYNVDALWEQVRANMYIGKYQELKEILFDLNRILPSKDVRPEYLLHLFELYFGEKKKLGDALKGLNNTLSIEPNNSFIRQTLEDGVLKYKNYKGLGISSLGKPLASHHLTKAMTFKKRYQNGLAHAHLRRALLLNASSQKAIQMQIPFLYEVGDYSALLFVYQLMKKKYPKNPKLHYRLSKLIKKYRKSLLYRSGLVGLSPLSTSFNARGRNLTLSSVMYTWRQSKKIFIFDIKPEEPFPIYPDISQKLSLALIGEFSQPGVLEAIPLELRDEVIKEASSSHNVRDKGYAWGRHYHSKYLRPIYKKLKNKNKTHYILEGGYRKSIEGGLQISLRLRDSSIGKILARYQIKMDVKDGMTYFAYKTRRAVLRNVPVEGRVVKVKGEDAFINLGKYDGLEEKKRLLVPRLQLQKKNITFRIQELEGYMSRVVSPSRTPLKKGDGVFFVKSE